MTFRILRCHLLLILLLSMFCSTAQENNEDYVCNMYNEPMFCNCEYVSQDEYGILCFVFRAMTNMDEIWSAFKNFRSKVVVALTVKPRLPSKLEFMPTSVLHHLPFLQRYSVHDGKLGSLKPHSVFNMTHLTHLLLERNEITNLELYSISHLPNLKKLILSENNLCEILAYTLVDLIDLEELFLDRNNISRIETCAFCSLHNLRELILWDNKLTDLTEFMFRGLRYLMRLDLYKNHIRVISANVFRSMPRLHELNLKENYIEHLSSRAFDGLGNLLKLHLNDNRIKVLPDEVFQFPKKLFYVDIDSNELRTIAIDVIKNLANVENKHFSMRFKGNPLVCGCDLRWIPELIESSESTTFSRELRHAKCRTKYGESKKVNSFSYGSECDLLTTASPLATEPSKTNILDNETLIPSVVYSEFYPPSGNNSGNINSRFLLLYIIAVCLLLSYAY